MAGAEISLPPHAHQPGRNPRHGEEVFTAAHASVRPGMDLAALEASLAWRSGWHFILHGYFWEAHEVLEPVWLALPPNAPERRFVQGLIQTANAALKLAMGQPRAALRIVDIAEALLAECASHPALLGLPRRPVEDYLSSIRHDSAEMARKLAL